MPTQVTNYQCPACTGPLHFVGASGKLECDYCGSSFDVADIEALYAHKEAEAAAAKQAADAKADAAAAFLLGVTYQIFPLVAVADENERQRRILFRRQRKGVQQKI